MNTLQEPPFQTAPGFARRADYLPALVQRLNLGRGDAHRYLLVAHLFDDTMRMIDALSGVMEFDAVIGVPYSSGSEATRLKWQARYGDRVHCPKTEIEFRQVLTAVLERSFRACRSSGRKLVVQEVGGYVVELLHEQFQDQLDLVEGVVEITKQGVWRAARTDLRFPVLHCADSELKRLEATRCGETIARCLDGLMRDLGNSLAGRRAAVFGAGWIGFGVAQGLRRLDMIPALIDVNPLKVAEARLNGFDAGLTPGDLGRCDLVIGAAGALSITADVLGQLRSGCLVASASSRRIEIDVGYLETAPSHEIHPSIRAFQLPASGTQDSRQICLVNDGYPANFIPGSGSVADEIVELILGELIVLMADLTTSTYEPGIHRLEPEGEATCTQLWIEQRDRM
ncbi:S-adenosylhomocysteine hydrolase [Roseibium sp. Sym1]|uniref:S-adenosylhomocysteine hydrolase n=1 Tax=Roseibium sp. Sym1 TaxID=3016006 RepID=UPI0022B3C47D|nr:S-adenosylhomocysteine hydrolase [Roseibium sp. Sym1]